VPHEAGFPNLITGTARHHQQLDVERKSVDRQAWKQGLGRFRTEQLEAALRIRDPGQHQQPHVRVKDASDRMAQPVFTEAPRSRRLARPDHNMRRRAATDHADKAIQVVGWHGQIGVRHEPPGPARLQHAAPDGGALPSAVASDQPDARLGSRMLLHHRARPVVTAIVDDDDLPREAQPLQVGAQLAQAASDGGFFVERGNDD
jgi:hypothetical protein